VELGPRVKDYVSFKAFGKEVPMVSLGVSISLALVLCIATTPCQYSISLVLVLLTSGIGNSRFLAVEDSRFFSFILSWVETTLSIFFGALYL
jgi:type IV secretory pathway VirB3-like protein